MKHILFFITLSIPLVAQAPVTQPAAYAFWQNAKLTASAWGAFNYSTKSDFTKAVDSALGTAGTYASPAFGATAWYGNDVSQLGFSAGYMQIYSNTATIFGQSQTEKLTYIPMVILARYFVAKGFWVGAGFGASVGLLKVDTGTATTKAFVSPLASLRTGYDYAITNNFSISGFLDLSFSFATINQQIGLTSATNYSANSLNIMPGLAVNYQF